MLICRALDPMILPTEARRVVKLRLLNFIRSLSTVMALGYCLSSFVHQLQKFFRDTSDSNDARNMGFDFAGKAVYNVVWVGVVSLFMVLLGFLTQKWLTAVGLGTVLLTLAGREIFTNFLSSVIIHTTRPFVLNEWIQTKIEGYQVSGTNENVPPAGSTDQNRRDNNIDAYSVAAAKVGPCSMPGARVGAFGNQVILPAHTIEHEEVINHTTFNL